LVTVSVFAITREAALARLPVSCMYSLIFILLMFVMSL
jgi:hypothetical protein